MHISGGCGEINDLVPFPAGSRIYVDTNIFIYFIETDGLLNKKSQKFLRRFKTPDRNSSPVKSHRPNAFSNRRGRKTPVWFKNTSSCWKTAP